MWQHNYEPIGGSLGLSAPVAAIPIVVLFLMLGVFRKAAWISALSALVSALIVALAAYGMPAKLAVIATIFLPLTFLTGFFGQNFPWMIGHIGGGARFLVLGIGLELATIGALVVFFRRRGWF